MITNLLHNSYDGNLIKGNKDNAQSTVPISPCPADTGAPCYITYAALHTYTDTGLYKKDWMKTFGSC
jgi:hypothetical protein